jgi:hypothetical protein
MPLACSSRMSLASSPSLAVSLTLFLTAFLAVSLTVAWPCSTELARGPSADGSMPRAS